MLVDNCVYTPSVALSATIHPAHCVIHHCGEKTRCYPQLSTMQVVYRFRCQKFLRQQSTATAPIPSSTDKHPLFTFAATYIQNIHDSRTFVSNSNPNKSTPPPPQNPGANNGGGGRYKPGGLELAAAASTTTPAPPASAPPASTAPNNSGPNPHQHEGKTIYTKAIRALPGPVLHTANIYFQHNANGTPKRYLAVATVHDICSNCFPVNASATAVPCKPPCTSRLCTRCNYYGHNGPWCLQTHTQENTSTRFKYPFCLLPTGYFSGSYKYPPWGSNKYPMGVAITTPPWVVISTPSGSNKYPFG